MAIRIVTNVTDHALLFINSESSRDNREIPPHSAKDIGGAWVPWCTRASDFPAHHFEIIDTDEDKVLWYIWQRHHPDDGDLIRCSRTGFENPGPAIPGKPGTSGDRQLWITDDSVIANNA